MAVGKYLKSSAAGATGGVATLGQDGKVPSAQLPAGGGEGGPVAWDDVTDKPLTFPPESHTHGGLYEPADAAIQTHIGSAHAPSNAQKNSDIIKSEIEAKLTGEISSHSHANSGGSDPWTYVALAADFTTSLATAQNVTGLEFTPAANTRYIFEAVLGVRSATATVNPRPGLAWATGMADGVATIEQTSTATAKLMVNGNIAAPLLLAVGGIPNNSASFPALCYGFVRAGANPSGNIRIQLASETAGTVVRIVTSSYLRYRTY